MGKFNKTRTFEKRDSDRSEKRDFSRSSRPEKRDFSRFKSEKDFDRRDSGRSSSKDSGFQLHQAICDKCGKECDVPFKPTGNKPIYCRACFRENESSDTRRSEPRGRYDDKPEFKRSGSSEDLDKINRKLDKIMKALKVE